MGWMSIFLDLLDRDAFRAGCKSADGPEADLAVPDRQSGSSRPGPGPLAEDFGAGRTRRNGPRLRSPRWKPENR